MRKSQAGYTYSRQRFVTLGKLPESVMIFFKNPLIKKKKNKIEEIPK